MRSLNEPKYVEEPAISRKDSQYQLFAPNFVISSFSGICGLAARARHDFPPTNNRRLI